MVFLIMLLFWLSVPAVTAILVAAAWRAMRALEEIAASVARIESHLGGRSGRDG